MQYRYLLPLLFILSFNQSIQSQSLSDSIKALALPEKDTNYIETIDHTKIIDSPELIEKKPATKNKVNNTPKIDSSYIYSYSYLIKHNETQRNNKHDSLVQASLNIMMELAEHGILRQKLDSVKQLIDSINIEQEIQRLSNYLNSLRIMKSNYNFIRQEQKTIDSIFRIKDPQTLSSVDSALIIKVRSMMNKENKFDSLTIQISIDSILQSNYIPDSLINSMIKFINTIKDDELLSWVSEVQNDTINFHLVNVNKDSVLVQLYKNSPQIINLNITDVWGTKTPAIIRNIQKKSFKLILDESAEIHQVDIDESAPELNKFALHSSNNVKRLQGRPMIKYEKPWTFYGNSSFNVSQMAFYQWTLGGESSIALLFGTELRLKYIKDKRSWDNYLKMKIGFIRQGDYTDTSNFFKSNEDILDYSTKFNWQLNKKTYATFQVDFKTRTFPSYDYTDTTREIASRFFSPANITFSLGPEYRINKKNIFLFAPASWNSTYVLDTAIDETRYGLNKGDKVRHELGFTFMARNEIKVWDNIELKSTLVLFSNYLYKPQNIDIRWDFEMILPINDYIVTKITASYIYNDDEKVPKKLPDGTTYDGKGSQFNERISVGLLYRY